MASKKRKTSSRTKKTSVKVASRRSRARGHHSAAYSARLIGALAILVLLIGAIGFMAFSGYQTATASQFFILRNVDVRGTARTPKEDIVRVVSAAVEKTGVWNSDLVDMKLKIEKFPFIRSASISRQLPSGIRVDVVERVPAAIAKLTSGNYLVDTEGVILVPVKGQEKDLPFVLNGWDESKGEKSGTDNIARLKVYKKMVDEARQFDVTERIRELNLANVREPTAVIEDSGRTIPISLSRTELGKSLKTAIDAVNGRGGRIRSVDSGGVQPLIQYLDL